MRPPHNSGHSFLDILVTDMFHSLPVRLTTDTLHDGNAAAPPPTAPSHGERDEAFTFFQTFDHAISSEQRPRCGFNVLCTTGPGIVWDTAQKIDNMQPFCRARGFPG